MLDNQYQPVVSQYLQQQESSSVLYHHRNEDIFDITPASNNKYSALQKPGVAVDNAYVFGNDSNDFTMLKHAGCSVFPGEPELFDNADHYCAIGELPHFIDSLSAKQLSVVS